MPTILQLCSKNQKCLECKDNYIFVGNINNEKIKCVDSTKINIGHYRINDSFYYECIDNCDICQNSTLCESCNSNSINLYDKCIKKIENCKEYNEDGSCKICNDNFGFIENNRNECINIEELNEYYSKDNGISYYKCDGEGDNHIKNCIKCNYNGTLNCDQCVDDTYNLLFNKCSPKVENCEEYNEDSSCKKCNNDFGFIENDKYKCYNKTELLGKYFTLDGGINFYSCSHLDQCKKCTYKINNNLNLMIVCTEHTEEYETKETSIPCSCKYISITIFFYFLILIFYN